MKKHQHKTSKSIGVQLIGLTAIGLAASCAFATMSYAQDGTSATRSDGRSEMAGSVSLPPCDTDGMVATVDLSTGSTNGNANAPGTVDPKWMLVSAPPGGPAAGNVYSRVPYGPWSPPIPPATWITPWANGQFVGNAVQGDYHYAVTFNVPPGYTNISVAGQCLADDEGTPTLNGGGGATPLCHYAGTPGTLNFPPGNVGSNTLAVSVHNGPPTINKNVKTDPTGLMVHATVSATCHIPAPPGNHYLCYNVEKPWKADVALRDQFGVFKFHVTSISRLCNPVEKQYNGMVSKIVNAGLHYVCYRGETKGISRNVMVNNQFGSTKLTANGPTELCLPSDKKELGRTDGSGTDGQR